MNIFQTESIKFTIHASILNANSECKFVFLSCIDLEPANICV